jgi:small subunit ribosomal protein S5
MRRRGNRGRGKKRGGSRRRYEKEKPEWIPRSELGKKVKAGEIKNIDELLDKGIKITEPEIVDTLVPDLETDFLAVGQSKGKFGGGKRKIYRHTQKKVREGARIKFAFLTVVGNSNGYVGIGYGTSRKSNSARETSIKKAKLNLTRVPRGCGSWECTCGENHSLPVKTTGKFGSVTVSLSPAPKGTGLVASDEAKKILKLAGISDVWIDSSGETRTRVNALRAVYLALKNLNMFR